MSCLIDDCVESLEKTEPDVTDCLVQTFRFPWFYSVSVSESLCQFLQNQSMGIFEDYILWNTFSSSNGIRSLPHIVRVKTVILCTGISGINVTACLMKELSFVSK